ncbi:recombination regulator RecX [Schinkia azotoformans]|uniref:recombination regulator RecX n=1 Tax=Schinkia azotoformans TaxID=1454 RepID=UPI002E1AFC3D|nr:recombination regulator RecX [Schinkia azotoformans]MED4352518.1 recombination regulator RecX [Schinkia azotoformans]
MIKISKITTQTKNIERFNIYIDKGNGEEYGFSVDQDVLIEFQIRKGNTYTEVEINEILYKDEIKKAFNLALKFLSYRMRAEKEIRDYLYKKDYSEDIAGIVIERLKKHQYVNDLEFAKAFVRSRIVNSAKGPLLIRQELQQKGVSEANIQESLKEFPEEIQLDIAFHFAEKNAKQNKTISDYQIKQKIGQALLAKGFSQPIVKTALSEIVIEKDEEQKFQAISKQSEKAYKRYSSKFEGWELDQKVKQYLYQRGFKSEEIESFLTRNKEDYP